MQPTIISENFFKNVDEIISISKKLKFEPPTSKDNWGGLRTASLHHSHYPLFNEIILGILRFYYPTQDLKFSDSFVHFHKLIPGYKSKTHYHYDDGQLVGLIYLSPGDLKNGTTFFNKKEEKQIIVGNDCNTVVCYDARKYHGATTLNVKKERLTLNVAIRNIEVS